MKVSTTKCEIWLIFVALSCFIFVLSEQAFGSSETINIFVPEHTKIENNRILLGDIGIISGCEGRILQEIENIDLGNAPLPERKKNIRRDDIIFRLKQKGLDPEMMVIRVADDAVVERSAVEISENEIKTIIKDYLDKKVPWDRNNTSIKDITVTNDVILPKGKISYKVVPQKNSDYLGTVPLFITFMVDGRMEKKIMVTANIEVMEEIVITRRPLGRYKIIKNEDISLKRMNLALLPQKIITNPDDVLGKRTKRAIDSNEILRADLIELPPVVKRGDIVLIIAESEGLKVTALGKVKEKGRKGDMIRIENIDSSKSIYARVVDSGNVVVDY